MIAGYFMRKNNENYFIKNYLNRKLIQQKRCLRRHFDFPEIDFNGLKMS